MPGPTSGPAANSDASYGHVDSPFVKHITNGIETGNGVDALFLDNQNSLPLSIPCQYILGNAYAFKAYMLNLSFAWLNGKDSCGFLS